ncbi:MAG: hypothetical protein CVU78_02540 [Elusimicrobia bacterium HGW-Elusimicrobia-2]|nr:MAG: hypothetical protein CVU78_02540 [Elusimicrobia bacterium HGW-Elusimicrobia-2]
MIIVCEPECRGTAHEKINSAFLYGVSLAYPEEKIVFFAEENHIAAMKDNFTRDKVSLKNIEYKQFLLPEPPYERIAAYFQYYSLLKKIFDYAGDSGCRKMFFLSANSNNLYCIKKILTRCHQDIKCGVVMHGIVETIKIKPKFTDRLKIWPYIMWFKNALEYRSDLAVNYLMLSKRAHANLAAYIGGNLYRKFFYMDIPYIFDQEYVKELDPKRLVVATIGHGNPNRLIDFVNLLRDKLGGLAEKNFEIRVISDSTKRIEKKLKDETAVNCVSPRKRLTRDEMDFHSKDVDYFLFLYDRDSYELTSSGAFFDALHYKTPIITLRNPGIQYYNDLCGDIGYTRDTIDELADILVKLITQGNEKEKYDNFVKNIETLKEKISIEKSFHRIKQLMESGKESNEL